MFDLTLQPKPDGGWGDGHWPNVSGQQRPPKSSSLGGAWDINDWMSGSRRVCKAILSIRRVFAYFVVFLNQFMLEII